MLVETATRHMCSQLVTLNRLGQPGSICGNLEEIGEREALVLATRPISCGTRVNIQCGVNHLRGTVKKCYQDVLGFFVEVDLVAASFWSHEWFTPEHLLMLAPSTTPKVFPRRRASGY